MNNNEEFNISRKEMKETMNKVVNEIYDELKAEYKKQIRHNEPKYTERLKTELNLYYHFKRLDKDKTKTAFDELKRWDSNALDKLMFENNDGKNKVMTSNTKIDKIYTELQQTEGIRQIAELFQSKHNEMQQIFNVLFS